MSVNSPYCKTPNKILIKKLNITEHFNFLGNVTISEERFISRRTRTIRETLYNEI